MADNRAENVLAWVEEMEGAGIQRDVAEHMALGGENAFKAATDAVMDRLGLSLGQLADMLDVSPREVRRWRAGSRPAPERVLDWLDRFSAWLRCNPVPLA